MVQNPGTFRDNLLINKETPVRLRRIIPEPKARNPKLADVLRVYRKWEGRGIGMATLVDLCLQDQIDVPYYILTQESVSLYLRPGPLLDSSMRELFNSMRGFLRRSLDGLDLTVDQELALAYIIKSDRENQHGRYTILLSENNNHFEVLATLERAGLIEPIPDDNSRYLLYVASEELVKPSFSTELREIFGEGLDTLDATLRDCLQVIYRRETYSLDVTTSAKQAANFLWHRDNRTDDIHAFDVFYRKIRFAFKKLMDLEFITKPNGSKGYILNSNYINRHTV